MYLFLLLIIPLFTGIVISLDKNYTFRNFIPQAVFALILATILCCIKEFFIYSSHQWIASPARNFIELFLSSIVLPFVILCPIHFLLLKDDIMYKAAAIFVLFAIFYAVCIPYSAIAAQERHSMFLLLYRPILYAGFSLYTSVFFRLASSAKKSAQLALFAMAFIFSLVAGIVPPLFETFRYFNGESVTLYALSLAYTIFALVLFLLKNAKNKEQY